MKVLRELYVVMKDHEIKRAIVVCFDDFTNDARGFG